MVTFAGGGVAVTLVGGVAVTLGDLRSIAGLELMDRGDRSIERWEFWRGECESGSDFVTPLFSLLTLGVAGVALLGVSDKLDLFKFKVTYHITKS